MHEASAIPDWYQRAHQVCALANISLTTKRMEVYASLLKAGHPLSAYELIDAVGRNFSRQLTPISIYRMLDFLQEQQLVRKLRSTGKYLAMSTVKATNTQVVSQFLICRECGQVRELAINPQVLMELKSCIDQCGYQLRNRELELDCVCDKCVADANPD